MLINEVCKECNLTKKAVEYYTEQGLIQPRIMTTEVAMGSTVSKPFSKFTKFFSKKEDLELRPIISRHHSAFFFLHYIDLAT